MYSWQLIYGSREAPFLGIPSLNFGYRQHGRCREPSITHTNDYDGNSIRNFLTHNWGKRVPRSTEFGEETQQKNSFKHYQIIVFGNKIYKNNFVNNKMLNDFNTIAVVPARDGSKGFPSKNFRQFNKKPLFLHAIYQALRTCDCCIFSSDNSDALTKAKY